MATAMELKEETLEIQEDAFRAIFAALPMGVLVADVEGRILFANPAAETILSAEDDDAAMIQAPTVCGWYLPDRTTLLLPEQLPLGRAVRGEHVHDEVVFLRRSTRQAGVWIRASAWPLTNRAGNVSGGVMIFHDVSEWHQSSQTNLLFSRVVEQIGDSVLLTDRQGVIEYVNSAFESTTGYSRHDVLGKTPRILKSGLHEEGFYRQLWGQVLEGHSFQGTIINRKKSGELCWTEQSITPIRDQAGDLTHFCSVMHDITGFQKKQEQEVQLRLARDVQRQFYATPPEVPGFDIAAAAFPAHETGGDYFDFIPMPHGLAIAVGDVEGHGFGSALVMALTRAYLRSFAALGLELEQMLTQVNHMLLQDLGSECFVTLALAYLDVHKRSLTYASAGHVPSYVFDESGEVEFTLESTGLPLGLFPDIEFSRHPPISLRPGQLVLLLTDGITESPAPDATEFGASRAIHYVRDHRSDRAAQLVDGLYHAVRAFGIDEPQGNDITSVVLKVSRDEELDI